MALATASPETSVAEPFPLCLDRELGAVVTSTGTRFAVWAPSASQVTLRLFSKGSPQEQGDQEVGSFLMVPLPDGSWQLDFAENKHGVFYDYLVEFSSGTVYRTADPWAKSAGVNGQRSMVVDLSRTNPEGWEHDRSPVIASDESRESRGSGDSRTSQPARAANDDVIWETHIADFSNDPRGGFPSAHRGRYLAFTDADTSLDGRGVFPTGVAYLKRLGVTIVQLLPFYDFGSVDETDGDQYNWGYDPVNYNVPEGSYATDPFDGVTRIRECKAMIQALHRAGIRVVMDVVYNHMFSPDNWFERMVPGYFCRRRHNGGLANGSGCGCDMATEHEMFRRYIVDSVTYWAREYHLDGFRFDLMGLIDTETMNQVRASLDALPGGDRILMYGEPWAAGPTSTRGDVTLADKRGLSDLDPRIGHFCDGTRDTIKGHVFTFEQGGFVNGCARGRERAVLAAVDAWRAPDTWEGCAGQVIQYVSAHDDLTLWDKLCMTMRARGSQWPADDVFAADGVGCEGGADTAGDADVGGADTDGAGTCGAGNADVADAADGAGRTAGAADAVIGAAGDDLADMFAANRIAAGLVLTSAGRPFMLAGEEFARTKYGDDNSYDSGATVNQLDWARAARLHVLVDYYARLIALRSSDEAWFDEPRLPIPTPAGMVGYRVGEYAVFANPEGDGKRVPARDVEASGLRSDSGSCSDSGMRSCPPSGLGPRPASLAVSGTHPSAGSSPSSWACVLDSDDYAGDHADYAGDSDDADDHIRQTAAIATQRRRVAPDGTFEIAPRTFTVWKRALR